MTMSKLAHQDFTFDFIHSLTKAEKRYFMLYAKYSSEGKTKNYLHLFNIMKEMKVYDKERIKTALQKHGKNINFDFAKNYLKKEIINCLAIMYGESTTDAYLSKQITTVKILIKKGCRREAFMLLNKAEKLAIVTEQFDSLQKIYNLQFSAISLQKDIEMLNKKLKVSKLNDNHTAYKLLATEVALYIGKLELSRSKKETEALRQLLKKSRLMSKETLALSLNAKIHFHHIKAIYYHFTGDFQSGIDHLNRRLHYQEKLPAYIKDNTGGYYVSLHNLINFNVMLKKYRKAENLLLKLTHVATLHNITLSHRLQVYNSYHYANTKITIGIKCGRVNALKEYLIICEKEMLLEKQLKSMEQADTGKLIDLYYNIAYAYFAVENYSESIKWCNRLSDKFYLTHREDISSVVKILTLINHYKKEHHELLHYIERSVRRGIKIKERLFKAETLLLNFFRTDLLKVDNSNERIAAFNKLKQSFMLLKKDSYESKAFEYFDFIAWVNSEIENRPFAETIREKMEGISKR